MPPALGWKGSQHKHKVTRRHIPEEGKLRILYCESIKSHSLTVLHLTRLTSSDSISLVPTQFDSYSSSRTDIRNNGQII
jgi:hypothetical protein